MGITELTCFLGNLIKFIFTDRINNLKLLNSV